MDISFDQLIQLQRIDSEIAAVNALLDSIPLKMEAIDAEIKATAAVVSGAKDKLSSNQKKRRELEGEVKTIREQTAKFKRQLNDVKTNKEYSSLLKEIEETDHKIARIEEDILNEMIAADDIEKEIKSALKKQGEEEGKLKIEHDRTLAEQKEIEKKKSALEKDRSVLLPRIPPDQLSMYQRIARKTAGVVLSPVTDDFCSICQLRVRPQMLDDLWAAKEIITCEACGRILYHQKPPEEAEPAAPIDDPNRKTD
ncbi:MAG: zinc ribbon domain-containing protein [Candidatus Aminicenantales bacterium]